MVSAEATVSATNALAAYAAGLDFAALPVDVQSRARIVLADSVGVLMAGSRGDAARTAMAAFPLGTGPCTVVGHGRGAAPEFAAFVNAAGAHETELDDTHSPSLTHPSAVLVPAALAAAEMGGGCSGATLLAALVAAYDVQARISKAMGPQAQFDRGLHPTSVCGAIGAAVCAARVLGLTAEQVRYAIGLAASQSSGIVAFRRDPSHMNKVFQPGVAARNGVFAALLARAGYLAAPDALDEPFDLVTAFGGTNPDRGQLVAELGERFEICTTTIKRHPSCGRSHAPIDALLALRAEHGFGPDDIAEIHVEVAHSVVPTIDGMPQLTHNLQYLLAVVAIAGYLDPAHLAPPWPTRPDVAELVARVRLSGSDELEKIFPANKGAVVSVRTRDGAEFVTAMRGPVGSPDAPLSMDNLRDKFTGLGASTLDPDGIAPLWALLSEIDRHERIDDLLSALGRPPGAR